MSKQIKSVSVLAILAIVFSVIAFAVPFPFGITFWIAYISGILSIALQIPIFKLAFDGAEELRSKVLGFPVFRVGYIYLTVQMLVSFAFFGLSFLNIPAWISLIVCVLVLGTAIICSISVGMARDEIQKIEQETKRDTGMMLKLRMVSHSLPQKANDTDVKKALEELAENFKFSDPVSNDETARYEESLELKLTELKTALAQGDKKLSLDLCNSASELLKERNEICKFNK